MLKVRNTRNRSKNTPPSYMVGKYSDSFFLARAGLSMCVTRVFKCKLGQLVRPLITWEFCHSNWTEAVRNVPHLREQVWEISKKSYFKPSHAFGIILHTLWVQDILLHLVEEYHCRAGIAKNCHFHSAFKNTTGSGHVPAFGNASDWSASRSREREN